MKTIIIALILVIILPLGFAMAIEEPSYKLVEQNDKYEIRY